MIDIHFYMKVSNLKRMIKEGQSFSGQELSCLLEESISPDPVIYNIETTNACNMKCMICPRTTMMSRPVGVMDMNLFEKIASQLKPHDEDLWDEWTCFVEREYGIRDGEMSENHFFLYIIPKVVVLHGFGEPLLDRMIDRRIRLLSEKNIPTYFSCNPRNIDIEKCMSAFRSGLNYIKFSVDSLGEERAKEIRGDISEPDENIKKIKKLVSFIRKEGLSTKVVVTMLEVDKASRKDYKKLEEIFKDDDIYLYFKSLDQKWMRGSQKNTGSIHWSEFCQYPWSSLTILWTGEVVACSSDYNGELLLGDSCNDSLREVWHGGLSRELRESHLRPSRQIKCHNKCDMKLISECCCES